MMFGAPEARPAPGRDLLPMPDWPHAPVHRLVQPGTYMVTAGTYLKRRILNTPERLQLVHDALLGLAERFGWGLHAWAVLANHYHFVAVSPDNPGSLVPMLKQLHKDTAAQLNRMDNARGRRVWFQYWDKELTYQRSYLVRLNYVQSNPVRHGVVAEALRYPWCSAAWFESSADPAFVRMVKSFKIDRLNEYDDF